MKTKDFRECMNPPKDQEEGIKVIGDLGNKLRDLRNKSNLSSTKVCEILYSQYGLQIQVNTLVSYESNNRVPNAKMFLSLCDIYQCVDVLGYFQIGETKDSTNIALDNYDLDGIVKVLINYYGESGVKQLIKILLDNMHLKS